MRGLGCWTVGNSGGTAEITSSLSRFIFRDKGVFNSRKISLLITEGISQRKGDTKERKEVSK